ncbi:hypothetical protein HUW52_27465 [Pseudomonas sp. 43A]|uniref:hypothetical protein n=1 Tax=unclassified Pseudomonas TaxID=196821 RepID=UPI001587873B|nr:MULTISPECIES: hypothetical protein [unclassified Pseudomonas]QKV66496.1 hypothetical protein HUW52_27465 [Pseudomonas sp. 43A]QMW11051.1 hypothetical protein H3303_05240 [Pseudomonas sp. 29A]
MEHEVIVEGFVLQVEVTRCENIAPCLNAWNSDWDFYGSRELEFKVLSAITYDDEGVRQKVFGYDSLAQQYGKQIETALWVEIDALQRRKNGRWAA